MHYPKQKTATAMNPGMAQMGAATGALGATAGATNTVSALPVKVETDAPPAANVAQVLALKP